ncbi:MAG: hypothetical protein KGZ65_06105 [Sphingomonadales bacterium]|nr:hypothetical protein [Sphingomonadaceae bacterium]MBS3930792.1 hypothetical protein [Sphingomonadales bacterium]
MYRIETKRIIIGWEAYARFGFEGLFAYGLTRKSATARMKRKICRRKGRIDTKKTELFDPSKGRAEG